MAKKRKLSLDTKVHIMAAVVTVFFILNVLTKFNYAIAGIQGGLLGWYLCIFHIRPRFNNDKKKCCMNCIHCELRSARRDDVHFCTHHLERVCGFEKCDDYV